MAFDTFEGYVEARSPKAMLFQSHYWEAPVWFPTSQIEVEHEESGGVVVRVKDWLTRKRGILEFTHYTAEYLEEANKL